MSLPVLEKIVAGSQHTQRTNAKIAQSIAETLQIAATREGIKFYHVIPDPLSPQKMIGLLLETGLIIHFVPPTPHYTYRLSSRGRKLYEDLKKAGYYSREKAS